MIKEQKSRSTISVCGSFWVEILPKLHFFPALYEGFQLTAAAALACHACDSRHLEENLVAATLKLDAEVSVTLEALAT